MGETNQVDYYIAPKESFEATADAIRVVTGESGNIEWKQNGFADAIGNEQRYVLDDIVGLAQNISGNIIYNGAYIRPYSFYGNTNITSFTGNNVTSLCANNLRSGEANSFAFAKCTNLISVSLPKITYLWRTDHLFEDCTKLRNVVLDYKNITDMNAYMFNNCTELEHSYFVLPKVVTDIYAYTITNNLNVIGFDIESLNTEQSVKIRNNAFNQCSNFNLLIIRSSVRVRGLDNINAFNGTSFASNGTGGILYVPQDLISSYQTATNWSTILSYENNQVLPIEGSIYETQYADGTPVGGAS